MILLADIGGTNARIGWLTDPWRPGLRVPAASTFKSASTAFATLEDFVRAAVEQIGIADKGVVDAVFSVAGPVRDGCVRLTNLDWPLASEQAIREMFGFRSCRFVNDLVAATWGVTGLIDGLLATTLQPGDSTEGARNVLLNVGTGLGVAYWSGTMQAFRVDGSEAGHMGFAPSSPEDFDYGQALHARHGRATWEYVLAASGLAELHNHFARQVVASSSAVVAEARGGDATALASITRFSRLLGEYAGDLALGAPAFGGVWLIGGVVDGLGELLDVAAFLEGFHAKGKMAPLLREVPVRKITEQGLGLVGAWRIATEQSQ